MGHNLGMRHDFMDKDIEGNEIDEYIDCRKISDGSMLLCSKCKNFQPDVDGQKIGIPTGYPDDCCNGFMGYDNHPHIWSKCSVLDFEKRYVSFKLDRCMDATATGNQSYQDYGRSLLAL